MHVFFYKIIDHTSYFVVIILELEIPIYFCKLKVSKLNYAFLEYTIVP